MKGEIKLGKNYYVLNCRSTGMGAFTTMNCPKYAISRTGNHWKERLPVEIGTEIIIKDISNSGKHYCRKVKIISVNPIEEVILEQADDICQFCSIF